MRLNLLLLLFAFGFQLVQVKAQIPRKEKVLKHEVGLLVENDVFVSLIRDRYYSSGIFASYRYLMDSSKHGDKILNMIRSYDLRQRMYTAVFVEYDQLEDIDRPYAGLLSASAKQQWYFKKPHYLSVNIELGWMGPANATGDIHRIWHGWFGLPEPRGWPTQLENAPIANLFVDHAFELAGSDEPELNGDIILKSSLAAGTIYNSIQESVIFRFGKIFDVNKTAHFGNTLGGTRTKFKTDVAVEAYVFYSPGVRYTLYDGTLEGGLINSGESIFTKEPRRWLSQQSFGLMLRYGTFDLNYLVYINSRETDGVAKHSYGAIELRQRF